MTDIINADLNHKIVFSIPHSGMEGSISTNTDWYLDTLYSGIEKYGCVVINRTNRDVVDVNRKARCLKGAALEVYNDFHNKLSKCLDNKDLLVDLHSFKTVDDTEIILSNKNDSTCCSELRLKLQGFFEKKGYRVKSNHPYTGGYITTLYSSRISTIQIEIAYSLYLDNNNNYDAHKVLRIKNDMLEVFSIL